MWIRSLVALALCGLLAAPAWAQQGPSRREFKDEDAKALLTAFVDTGLKPVDAPANSDKSRTYEFKRLFCHSANGSEDAISRSDCDVTPKTGKKPIHFVGASAVVLVNALGRLGVLADAGAGNVRSEATQVMCRVNTQAKENESWFSCALTAAWDPNPAKK